VNDHQTPMKLLRSNIRTPNMDDNVGRGIEMAMAVAVFVAIGYGLDRWLGTMPIFMIVMTVLAGIGFFAKFRYQYEARMNELQAERAERAAAGRGGDE
jgi:F0F1-type ATP synthase assembly protein I